MCVNYGGRQELVDAVRSMVATGAPITEKSIQKHLYTHDLPDVDLFVRSSGEQRTSNFMLWQSAYAEMVFLDTLWPDFSRVQLWAGGRAVRAPRPPLRRRRSTRPASR